MRIGIVSEYVRPWPGGISEHVHYEAAGLQKRGHHVQIYSGPGPSQSALSRLPYEVCFGSNGAKNRLSLGKELISLGRKFTRDRLDVLHVHAPLDPILPLTSVLAAPCPVVGTFHASLTPSWSWDLYHLVLGPFARRALRRITTSIAVSEEAARSLHHYFEAPCEIIPNGVDLARFAAPLPLRAVTQQQRQIILFVGRPDPRKGLPVLLEAFEHLLSHGLAVTLELVGVRNADLPLRFRRNPFIVCHGVVEPEQVPARFFAADVVCAPSLRGESQGVVLLEAMAAGKALLCSDIPGYREVVQHQRDGLLVKAGRADEWARALEQVLRDPTQRHNLGRTARARARNFGFARVLDALEAVLLHAAQGSVKSLDSMPACQPSSWN